MLVLVVIIIKQGDGNRRRSTARKRVLEGLKDTCCSPYNPGAQHRQLLCDDFWFNVIQMKATPSGKISALIISPTRELASQIAVEAQALGKFHNITVQVSSL